MGVRQLAEWMNQHPAERLAAWRRVLPAAIAMTADDMVDAALAGLDQGEVVTIPSLADKADWDLYEAARHAMSGKLSSAVSAPRYNISASASTSKSAATSTH